jgi:hypothetical protein
MIGSLVPVGQPAVAESTAGREVCDDTFPIVDEWHSVQTVEKAQMLKKVVLTPKRPHLLLTGPMVVLFKVAGAWIKLIAIGTMGATC